MLPRSPTDRVAEYSLRPCPDYSGLGWAGARCTQALIRGGRWLVSPSPNTHQSRSPPGPSAHFLGALLVLDVDFPSFFVPRSGFFLPACHKNVLRELSVSGNNCTWGWSQWHGAGHKQLSPPCFRACISALRARRLPAGIILTLRSVPSSHCCFSPGLGWQSRVVVVVVGGSSVLTVNTCRHYAPGQHLWNCRPPAFLLVAGRGGCLHLYFEGEGVMEEEGRNR